MSNCKHFSCYDISIATIDILLNTKSDVAKLSISMAFQETLKEHGTIRIIEKLNYWIANEEDEYKIDWERPGFVGLRSLQQGNNEIVIEIKIFYNTCFPNSDIGDYILGKAYMQNGKKDMATRHFESLL